MVVKVDMPEAKYYLLSLQYTDNKGTTTVGNVQVIDNKFVFDGNVEESANQFFNVTLKKLVDDYLKVRAEHTEKPYIKKMEEDCYADYSTINAIEVILTLLKKLGYIKLVKKYREMG